MHDTIELETQCREQLVDITSRVHEVVRRSGLRNGIVNLDAQGATAAIMIQENWDTSVPTDVVDFLRRLVPPGMWLHDRQDDNGDAHIKAGLVGPSETIPVINGTVGLSTWQGVFFCEFDGPRRDRRVVCTLLGERTEP
jgi:secondary thiamine-phosphate synthase enzyme